MQYAKYATFYVYASEERLAITQVEQLSTKLIKRSTYETSKLLLQLYTSLKAIKQGPFTDLR